MKFSGEKIPRKFHCILPHHNIKYLKHSRKDNSYEKNNNIPDFDNLSFHSRNKRYIVFIGFTEKYFHKYKSYYRL